LINHKITYDTVMKKKPRPRCPSFVGIGGKCHRSIAYLLTATSSHYLATLPAKASAFSSHMQQNA